MLTVALILGAIAAFAIVTWAIINRKKLIEWFRQKHPIKNENEVAFTLKTKMQNGDFEVVNGVFNQDTNEFPDGEVIKSGKMSDEVAGEKDLVVYN